jgi:hypothetical protein
MGLREKLTPANVGEAGSIRRVMVVATACEHARALGTLLPGTFEERVAAEQALNALDSDIVADLLRVLVCPPPHPAIDVPEEELEAAIAADLADPD